MWHTRYTLTTGPMRVIILPENVQHARHYRTYKPVYYMLLKH